MLLVRDLDENAHLLLDIKVQQQKLLIMDGSNLSPPHTHKNTAENDQLSCPPQNFRTNKQNKWLIIFGKESTGNYSGSSKLKIIKYIFMQAGIFLYFYFSQFMQYFLLSAQILSKRKFPKHSIAAVGIEISRK